MVFRIKRCRGWAAGLLTACTATATLAQNYAQPTAQPPAQYATQPAAYQQYPNQNRPAPYGQPQATPPAAYQTPAQQAPRQQYPNQPTAYQGQPAAYQGQPASNPAQAGGYQGQPGAYAGQPAAYGNQPARPQQIQSPAQRGYVDPRSMQVPGAVTSPENYAASAGARGGVRPVQFEQPVDGQPAAGGAAAQTGAPPQAGAPAATQQPMPADPPGFRATEISNTPLPNTVPADVNAGQQAQEHPLMPALRWAKQGLAQVNQIQDYSCTLVKRERIDGTLGEHEYIFVKVRHQPFSVYTYFLGPARVKGQEAIFVDGQNDGSLLAHGNGIKHRLIGTVQLKPTSMLAMSGNRYPITEMGVRRLLERLLEIGNNDVKYGECNVKWIQGAKINHRVCTCIQVEHPYPRRNFLFNVARIYVDDELQLPIRYEAYEWPAAGTTQPQLTEEYTFLNMKLNNGFTDADFSADNPSYGFRAK